MLKRYFLKIIVLICAFSFAYAQQNLRGWHTQGQTFLIWEHSGAVPADTTYEIYRSPQPINSLSNATRIGRVFANHGENKRIQQYVPNVRWKIPDTLGGLITVGTNEAYFVVTPDSVRISYYAVVLFNDTIVSSSNTIGPIQETIEPVTCVMQYQDSTVKIYSHWIDGRTDYNAGRLDYPVMGNQYSNGLGFNFAVWKRGDSLVNLPMVVGLHGGGSNLIEEGLVFKSLLSNGLFVTFDDVLPARHLGVFVEYNTFWSGYANTFNPFVFSLPNNSAVVVNYTARRLWWEIEWLKRNLPIDSNRISVNGISMGGAGTLLHTQLKPALFSAGLSYVPVIKGIKVLNDQYRVYPVFGTPNQNLPTNFDGTPGIYDLLDEEWRLQQPHPDWPFTLIVSGKNDTNATWTEKPAMYRQLDSSRTGFALYWDEREHLNWIGAHFRFSEHLKLTYLTRFRNNQSFPAFSNTDLDLITPGRQPDPGDGNPNNGDPWGTWGGYLEWDPNSIIDNPDRWSVIMWVVYQSSDPNDIPDADTILADVTLRRLQRFQPNLGFVYAWDLVRVANGETLQSETVSVDTSGVLTINNLLLIKEPLRLAVWGPVGIGETENSEKRILLSQVYPNPFTFSTTIKYIVKKPSQVELKIYNLAGQLIKTLVDEYQNSGEYIIDWDGKDDNKCSVSSGVFFLRMNANNSSQIKKLLFLSKVR